MSWPALKESYRFIDWSYFNNTAWPLYRPYDVAEFVENHPEVDGVVLRFNWPGGQKDKHYDHYFDGFTDEGLMVAGYGWPNKNKPLASVMEDWKTSLGDRVPWLLFSDWEESSSLNGLTKFAMTDLFNRFYDRVRTAFVESEHGCYSRSSWLDGNIFKNDKTDATDWWLAHWIFPPPDFQDQARSYSELDPLLPIGNSFTPFKGNVIKIPQEQVVGWQASAKLEITPRSVCDGSYFLRSYIDQIYNSQPVLPDPPVPPDPPTPVPGTETITILESTADDLRSALS